MFCQPSKAHKARLSEGPEAFNAINMLKKIQHEPALLHNGECEVLIGICTQIAYKNPSLYTHCCQLLSSLLSILPEEEAKTIAFAV